MSYEQAINRSNIRTSVSSDGKDLHFHIDVRLGASDLAFFEPVNSSDDTSAAPTPEQLAELASRIYESRRIRSKVLDPDLFGEPAWDILLAVYCLPARGERLSITDVSLAADLPQATSHRWQQILAQRELLDHFPDEQDRRRSFVKLSDKGRELLELYLTRLFRCGNPFRHSR